VVTWLRLLLHCPLSAWSPAVKTRSSLRSVDVWRLAHSSGGISEHSEMGQKSSAQMSGPVAMTTIHVGPQTTPTPQTHRPASTFSVDTKTRANASWKYEGYKDFSEWMASDDDLFIFRRFANVNAQVILWMQNKLAQKEARLETLHKDIAHLPLDSGWRNDSFEWDAVNLTERDDLMRELSALVLHYSKFLIPKKRSRTYPRAR
jgi:hypothetical protein